MNSSRKRLLLAARVSTYKKLSTVLTLDLRRSQRPHRWTMQTAAGGPTAPPTPIRKVAGRLNAVTMPAGTLKGEPVRGAQQDPGPPAVLPLVPAHHSGVQMLDLMPRRHPRARHLGVCPAALLSAQTRSASHDSTLQCVGGLRIEPPSPCRYGRAGLPRAVPWASRGPKVPRRWCGRCGRDKVDEVFVRVLVLLKVAVGEGQVADDRALHRTA